MAPSQKGGLSVNIVKRGEGANGYGKNHSQYDRPQSDSLAGDFGFTYVRIRLVRIQCHIRHNFSTVYSLLAGRVLSSADINRLS